jgi:hypothetical protein
MDRAAALEWVADEGAITARPALDSAKLGAILDAHARVDANGLTPADDGWTPTWDLNGAVASVYRRKAAQVAGDYNFSADGLTVSKGDVLANLLAMEAHYAGKSTGGGLGTIEVGGTNGPFNLLDRVADRVIP